MLWAARPDAPKLEPDERDCVAERVDDDVGAYTWAGVLPPDDDAEFNEAVNQCTGADR